MTGTLIIVSAPSGAGKTSLVEALLKADPRLSVSVSHTTRDIRPGETDGRNYHFVDHAQFVAMREAGEFLESADVFDNLYGTSRTAVREQLDDGWDVILEIDWQGARQVRAIFDSVVSIFVIPPSRATLRSRLQARGRDNAKVISDRMRQAINEMSHYRDYDYLVVNDDFDAAVGEMQAILTAERLRRVRQQHRLSSLLDDLLSE